MVIRIDVQLSVHSLMNGKPPELIPPEFQTPTLFKKRKLLRCAFVFYN